MVKKRVVVVLQLETDEDVENLNSSEFWNNMLLPPGQAKKLGVRVISARRHVSGKPPTGSRGGGGQHSGRN